MREEIGGPESQDFLSGWGNGLRFRGNGESETVTTEEKTRRLGPAGGGRIVGGPGVGDGGNSGVYDVVAWVSAERRVSEPGEYEDELGLAG